MSELMAAVERQDLGSVEQWLAKGAPVDGRDARGRTPLLVAVLANAGADVNARDDTQLTPYLCAGANGFHEILRCAIDAGADLRSVNRFGGTALLPSSEKAYLRTVQLCLDAGVPVNHANQLGWTALLEAVILGDGGRLYTDVVATLVAAGADIHQPDRGGRSSLWHAQALGQLNVLRIFGDATGLANARAAPTGRVRALIRRFEYEAALAALAEVQKSGGDRLGLHYYRGYLLGESGRSDEALAEYRHALAVDPQALEFHFYAANCLRSMKRPDAALREYDTAISLKPQAAFHRYQKSNYLRELNRHDEAVAEMDRLLEQQPQRFDFSFHRANSLRSLGRHDDAIQAIEKAIAVDPDNPLYTAHKAQSLALLQRSPDTDPTLRSEPVRRQP
jgi:Flp pilus assembly protein TadD